MNTTTIDKSSLTAEDFFTIEINNGIATIWMDFKHEKMNVVSPDLIQFFDSTFQTLNNNPEIKAGILISAKPDFIAGADIKSFKAEKKGDFEPITRKGQEILNAIESSKKPIVAAINGTCYGLGLEISLACQGRICSDHRNTKLALPEVKLGLLPGGGGTQRLPKLVGLQKALDMMLTGKNIFPRQAKKMGLVDEVVNHNKLHIAATSMAHRLVKSGPIQRKRKKKLFDRFLDDTSVGRNIVFKKAREKVMKLTQGNYPAVPEIINCVEIGYKNGFKAGSKAEAEKFEELMLSQISKELRNLFFNMTDNKKNPWVGQESNIQSFGVLGAGFMGAGIAEVSIHKDMDVLLKDLKDEVIQDARKGIWKSLKRKVKKKQISKVEAEEIINRTRGLTDYEGFEHLDLVIEAVVENMELKKKIIKELEAICKEDFIFATNTSSLSVTEMAKAAKRPENVIGMHYFSPVPKMPLLEIVKTEYTSESTLATCYELGIKQGKTCIVVNDCPGFYVNRILAPYLNEIMLMIEEGAKIDALDKALKKKGMPVGPVALMDEVGIDIGAHVMGGDISEVVKQREGVTVSMGLPKMFEAGYLGKKNKKGFYKYEGKKGKRSGVNEAAYQFFGGSPRKEFNPEEITERSILLLLNEAVMCLEEGIISSPTDGDTGAVFGIGFLPWSGGPFRFMDSYGIENIVNLLKKYQDIHGPKFAPRPMLIEMANNQSNFYKGS